MLDWELDDPFLDGLVLLAQAFEACKRSVVLELGRDDLTLAHFNILLLLYVNKGPLTPGQMSSCLFRERHTISALLTRMQKLGYITKTKNMDDERVVEVRITAMGRKVIKRAMANMRGYSRDLVQSCFSEEQVKEWNEAMRRLRDHALETLGEKVETRILDRLQLATAGT